MARVHARNRDPSVISGCLGKGNEFANSIAKFAISYDNQNDAACTKMLEAIKRTKITNIK